LSHCAADLYAARLRPGIICGSLSLESQPSTINSF